MSLVIFHNHLVNIVLFSFQYLEDSRSFHLEKSLKQQVESFKIFYYLIKKYLYATGLDMSLVPYLASAVHPSAASSGKQATGD